MKPARTRTAAALAALAFLLAGASGCSKGSGGAEATGTASAPAETTVAPPEDAEAGAAPSSTSEAEAEESATAAASATASNPPAPSLEGAYAGYGKAMPDGAVQASVGGTWYAGEYVAQSSDGTIQVVFIGDEVRIYVEHWAATKPYGRVPGSADIHNGIVLSDGAKPEDVASFAEWPLGQPAADGGDYTPAETIAPGQALYNGNYVCAGSDKGLTCWNVISGHGAFVTTEGFTAF